jgi:hypothetical protein
MFGLFTGKKAKLEQKYAKLLEESHRLSHINRKDSDLSPFVARHVRFATAVVFFTR